MALSQSQQQEQGDTIMENRVIATLQIFGESELVKELNRTEKGSVNCKAQLFQMAINEWGLLIQRKYPDGRVAELHYLTASNLNELKPYAPMLVQGYKEKV